MPRRPAKFISEIEALRNLGPKSAAWLADIGITTRDVRRGELSFPHLQVLTPAQFLKTI